MPSLDYSLLANKVGTLQLSLKKDLQRLAGLAVLGDSGKLVALESLTSPSDNIKCKVKSPSHFLTHIIAHDLDSTLCFSGILTTVISLPILIQTKMTPV